MHSQTAGIVLSCTLGVSAFLLPPPVAAVTDSISVVATPVDDAALHNQLISLPCSSCAPPHDGMPELENELRGLGADDDSVNHLWLNFTISPDRPTELQVNEHTIYPFDLFTELENLDSNWRALQAPATVGPMDLESEDYVKTSLRITSAGMSIGPSQTFAPDNEEIINIRWQLLGLDGKDVTMDPVFIQVIKQADGNLIILSINKELHPDHVMGDMLIPLPQPVGIAEPSGDATPSSDCGFLPQALCDLRHRIAGKLPKMHKPCGMHAAAGKTLPTHINTPLGPFNGVNGENVDEQSRPHPDWHNEHPQHHHHHHHQHHGHGVFHAISRGILAILIPVMAGITVGMAVSILGLMFGRFVGWLWFTVIPGRRRGYTTIAVEDDLDSEEKKVGATDDNTDTLPVYEEAPAYEEVSKELK